MRGERRADGCAARRWRRRRTESCSVELAARSVGSGSETLEQERAVCHSPQERTESRSRGVVRGAGGMRSDGDAGEERCGAAEGGGGIKRTMVAARRQPGEVAKDDSLRLHVQMRLMFDPVFLFSQSCERKFFSFCVLKSVTSLRRGPPLPSKPEYRSTNHR